MAPGTIRPNSPIVHIGMTRITVGLCFRKDQAFVARTAVDPNVLAGEGKIGFGMAELRRIPADLPACRFGKYWPRPVPGIKRDIPTGRRMTVGAVNPEVSAVRGLREQADRQSQK